MSKAEVINLHTFEGRQEFKKQNAIERFGQKLGQAYFDYVFGDGRPPEKDESLSVPDSGIISAGKFASAVAEMLGSEAYTDKHKAVEALLSAVEVRERKGFRAKSRLDLELRADS